MAQANVGIGKWLSRPLALLHKRPSAPSELLSGLSFLVASAWLLSRPDGLPLAVWLGVASLAMGLLRGLALYRAEPRARVVLACVGFVCWTSTPPLGGGAAVEDIRRLLGVADLLTVGWFSVVALRLERVRIEAL